jgi:cbb3-type cytochrome c oxidase subunit III
MSNPSSHWEHLFEQRHSFSTADLSRSLVAASRLFFFATLIVLVFPGMLGCETAQGTSTDETSATDEASTQSKAEVPEEEPEQEPQRDALDPNDPNTLRDAAAVEATVERGGELFVENCSACHGRAAEGTIGPNLTDEYWLHGGELTSIYDTIHDGVPARGCPAWGNVLTQEQIVALVAYIYSIRGSDPPNARDPQGEAYERSQTSGE